MTVDDRQVASTSNVNRYGAVRCEVPKKRRLASPRRAAPIVDTPVDERNEREHPSASSTHHKQVMPEKVASATSPSKYSFGNREGCTKEQITQKKTNDGS